MPTTVDRNWLAASPLFTGLEPECLNDVLPHLDDVTFEAGGHVFIEGEKGRALYVIAEGRVRVTKAIPGGHQAVVAELGPGDVFGEMALLTHAPRSTSCEFVTAGRLVSWDRERVDTLRTTAPTVYAVVLRNLGCLLSRRLAHTTGEVCDMLSDMRPPSEAPTVVGSPPAVPADAPTAPPTVEVQAARAMSNLEQVIVTLERPATRPPVEWTDDDDELELVVEAAPDGDDDDSDLELDVD